MEIGDIAHVASEPHRHWTGIVIEKREQHNTTVVDVEGIEHKGYKATAMVSCFILKNDEYWMYSIDNYCVVCESEGKTAMQVLGYGVCADCLKRIVKNCLTSD